MIPSARASDGPRMTLWLFTRMLTPQLVGKVASPGLTRAPASDPDRNVSRGGGRRGPPQAVVVVPAHAPPSVGGEGGEPRAELTGSAPPRRSSRPSFNGVAHTLSVSYSVCNGL